MYTLKKYARILTLGLTVLFAASVANKSEAKPAPGWFLVDQTIAEASYKTGVDVKLLTAMAAIESTFKVDAKNGQSSAKGLFQFTKRTWNVTLKNHGKQYGLPLNADPHDPLANSLMGAEYIKENINVMAPRIGRMPTYTEVYMAHLLSPIRAAQIATAPNHVFIADMYQSLAKYNQSLFYKDNGDKRTVGEFKQLMNRKVSKALHVYGDLANMALVAYKDETIELKRLDKLLAEVTDVCEVDPREVIGVRFIGTDKTVYLQDMDTDWLPIGDLPVADRRRDFCKEINNYNS